MKSRLVILGLLLVLCLPQTSQSQWPYNCNGSLEPFCTQPGSSQPCGWSVYRFGCINHSNCNCSGSGNYCYREDGHCNCSWIIVVHFSQCFLGTCNCGPVGEGGQES